MKPPRRSMIILAVLCAVLFGAVPGVRAAETSAIRGTVSDPQGAPIASAYMTLYDSQDTILRSTYTDDAGDYGFSDLPAGTYKLSADVQSVGNAFAPGRDIARRDCCYACERLFYDGSDSIESATRIVLADGEVREAVAFQFLAAPPVVEPPVVEPPIVQPSATSIRLAVIYSRNSRKISVATVVGFTEPAIPGAIVEVRLASPRGFTTLSRLRTDRRGRVRMSVRRRTQVELFLVFAGDEDHQAAESNHVTVAGVRGGGGPILKTPVRPAKTPRRRK